MACQNVQPFADYGVALRTTRKRDGCDRIHLLMGNGNFTAFIRRGKGCHVRKERNKQTGIFWPDQSL